MKTPLDLFVLFEVIRKSHWQNFILNQSDI